MQMVEQGSLNKNTPGYKQLNQLDNGLTYNSPV